MSKFVQAAQMEPLDFDGDKVTATLKPLKRKLYVQVMPFMQQMNAIQEEKKAALGRDLTKEDLEGMGADPRVTAGINKIMDILGPELKEYVVELGGLRDAAGVAIPLETVVEAAYFAPVAAHIGMQLVRLANVKEDDAGKADRPSAA